MLTKKLYSQKAAEFMRRSEMHPDRVGLDASTQIYINEMEKGLKEKGMLPMVPTYLHGDFSVAKGKKALAVDVGGTNLRLALAEVDSLGRVRLSRVKKSLLPGLKAPVESEVFFDTLAENIAPYLKYTDMISFSFAHEVHHMPDMDGQVVELSKELTVYGIEGQPLGVSLKKALAKRGEKAPKIVVINDTVGVACSMALKRDEYDSFIGMVMGTGTNTCYIEQSANITKINDANTPSMFINMESAEFIPERGKYDLELDSETEYPESAPLEKMISGRYVGNLFWYTVRGAVREGLLSASFSNEFGKLKMTDTIALSEFLSDPDGSGIYSKMCQNDSDRAVLNTIAELLVERGAKLIALEVAGIAVKTGKGRDAKKPVCVVAEGTTYYTLKGLKRRVEKILYGWLKETKGVHVKVLKVDNAALKGIGVVGLSYM